jgi:hypothetical protein
LSGVRAITTNSSARVPFVHQSFCPLMIQCLPSSESAAEVVTVRGIGAGVHLGERERSDRALRDAREVLPLLFLGAEELERLRHTDGLRRREERDERSALRRHHLHRLHVGHLREPEPAVFRGNLDAERAHVAQRLHVRLADVAGAVHFVGVVALEERAQLVHERLRPFQFRRILERVRMDQLGAEPSEEEFAHEARMRPLGLARGLGDVARLRFGGVGILDVVGHVDIPSAVGVRAPRRRPRRRRRN